MSAADQSHEEQFVLMLNAIKDLSDRLRKDAATLDSLHKWFVFDEERTAIKHAERDRLLEQVAKFARCYPWTGIGDAHGYEEYETLAADLQKATGA